jgi:hypothetical protein
MNLAKRQDALRRTYEEKTLRLIDAPADENALRELLNEWPTLYPPWTMRLDDYDSASFGPLLAVSDEGAAAQTIADAAYASAKARSLKSPDAMAVGVMIDGERMTSAGEAPIGPDEYEQVISAAFGRTLCSTNVGVRANTRLYRLFPEFPMAEAVGNEGAWLERVFEAFRPFLNTPDGKPRPLTTRLLVRPGDSLDLLGPLVGKLEDSRKRGRLADPLVHRLSLLMVFDHEIRAGADVEAIKRTINAASKLNIPEVAIDGELTFVARERVSVQSLLNVVDTDILASLFAEARRANIRLVYRYQIDAESAARTIWTGLHAARSYGFTVGKYGLVPLSLNEQLRVIELVSSWTKGWTAIPAFYADTPLVTEDEVFDPSRCTEAALLWMERVKALGIKMILVDCPDRVTPRHLLRDDKVSNDKGAMTLEQLLALQNHASALGLRILWSGGITARQAFSLAAYGAFAIFSTSATARQVAVHGVMTSDPELAAEGEPTDLGVRRVHAAIQGGFLSTALLPRNQMLATEVNEKSMRLLASIDEQKGIDQSLQVLDESLVRGWNAYLMDREVPFVPKAVSGSSGLAVAPDAVRVWCGRRRRGRRRDDLKRQDFLDKLAKVFMPFTVQMQRLYGLTAYLPAVLPAEKHEGLPDEIALVFYKTQQAYDDAKEYPGGQAYSDLHSVVFDLQKSTSGFPEFFNHSLSLNKPYYLFQTRVDWKKGIAHLYVGARKKDVDVEDYRTKLESKARNIQRHPGVVDAAILFASVDWIVYWQHSATEGVSIPSFSEVTDSIMSERARSINIPTKFAASFEKLQVSSGDFFNFQFSNVD